MNDVIIATYQGHRYVFGPFNNETDLWTHQTRLEQTWHDVFIEVYPINPPNDCLGLAETIE